LDIENVEALPLEAATNRRYLEALRAKIALANRPVVSISDNERWLENVPRGGQISFGPLIARVGLTEPDEDLGRDFYIGARWIPDFDRPVISWDAPLARVFYDPDGCKFDMVRDVVVRRSLLERNSDIIKVFDNWVSAQAHDDPPFARPVLNVPAPPPAPAQEPEIVREPEPELVDELVGESDVDDEIDTADEIDTEAESPEDESDADPAAAVPSAPLEEGMRSADAVTYALLAPRSEALTSVLATLQPDQYRLVTSESGEPLIIQGHPGTGKTIIGIHRASYLVSEGRGEGRAGKLLLLGPTPEWVRHVVSIIRTLDVDRRIVVRAMPLWFAEIAGLGRYPRGDLEGAPEDVGAFLPKLIDQAVELCGRDQPWATGGNADLINLERVFECIRRGGIRARQLETPEIAQEWLASLPRFDTAVRRQRFLPLFARASLAVRGGRASARYDHVVVDEAQDVSGIEWEVVKAHNAGSWTIVGDMNQRRTDFGDSSWKALAKRLGLPSYRIEVIRRGYRSTQAILDFADPLLPRAERGARSLQQAGPTPIVTRARTQADRDPLAVREAERLLATYSQGTVAMITIAADHEGIERALLAAGWRRAEDEGDWHRAGQRLAVRTPESARGVEFDGVVVVEPSAFPRNRARVGPLYTSLTRANRELAVVHHRALPKQLRPSQR
jgi:hypothetical protein